MCKPIRIRAIKTEITTTKTTGIAQEQNTKKKKKMSAVTKIENEDIV